MEGGIDSNRNGKGGVSDGDLCKFLVRLGSEYLCYAARQSFYGDNGSPAVFWAYVSASLRCLEAVRYVRQDGLSVEAAEADYLISRILFKYVSDVGGALKRIEAAISTIRLNNAHRSAFLFEASSLQYEILLFEKRTPMGSLHKFLNRLAREALSIGQTYWYYYFMSKRVKLLFEHSTADDVYALLDSMEKEADKARDGEVKALIMLDALEAALKYLLIRRADHCMRALMNFLNFDPFDTSVPLWTLLEFFRRENEAQRPTVIDRIKIKLVLNAAVYCICKRDVGLAIELLQRLSDCLSAIKQNAGRLSCTDPCHKTPHDLFNELLKISALIPLLLGICLRERSIQDSRFYFHESLGIAKQMEASVRQVIVEPSCIEKVEDILEWLSIFSCIVQRHLVDSHIASSDCHSALNWLTSIVNNPNLPCCSPRFMRRLQLNMGQIYQYLGIIDASVHYLDLALSRNDPEVSFISYSSMANIGLLGTSAREFSIGSASLNALNEYVSSLGNFGVVQTEVTSALRALMHFSRIDIRKAKANTLDVLKLYGHRLNPNISLVCLCIVGALYLDANPEKAMQMFITAKKLSSVFQIAPFMYISIKFMNYAGSLVRDSMDISATLCELQELGIKIKNDRINSVETLQNFPVTRLQAPS